MKFLSNLFHKPSIRTAVIVAIGGALSAIGHSGLVPAVSPGDVDTILGVLAVLAKGGKA